MEVMFLLLLVMGEVLRVDGADGEFLAAVATADCCCCRGNVGSTEAGGCPGFELDEPRGLQPLPPAAAALLFDTEFWEDPAATEVAAADDNNGLLPAPKGLLDEVTPNDICVW